MEIITEAMQKKILKYLGIKRLTKLELSQKVELSQPTIRKVLDNKAPVIVTNRVFNIFQELIKEG